LPGLGQGSAAIRNSRAESADWRASGADRFRGPTARSANRRNACADRRGEVSGANHPATLTDRANLACWTGMAGDAAAARDQYAALVPVIERVSGAQHHEAVATRANLARWTSQAEK
jgi:hypothetical protein